MHAAKLLLIPIVLLIAKPGSNQPQPTGWVGKSVMPKKIGIKLTRVNDDGELVEVGELTELDYRVQGDDKGRILIKSRQGVDGWIDKSQVVLLDDAVIFFTGRIQQDGNDADAYNRRAWAWKLKGELDIAIKDFGESLRINPGAAIYNNRATAYHAKRDYPKAIDDYSEAIRLNPKFVLPYFNRALLWEEKRDIDKAIDDYTEAIKIDNRYANAYRNRGYMRHLKRDYKDAIEDFSEAIQLDPRDINAYNDRGNSFHDLKEYDKAIRGFNECVRLEPKFIYAFYNRARAYEAKKDNDKAIDDYSEAIRINPKYSIAYWGRAAVRIRMKDYEKGVADYNEALRFDGKNANLLNGVAWLLATCPDEKGRDGKRAVELAKQALELRKDDPNIMDTLAAAYAEVGNFDEAVRFQEQALRDPAFENNPGYRERLELYKKKIPYRQE